MPQNRNRKDTKRWILLVCGLWFMLCGATVAQVPDYQDSFFDDFNDNQNFWISPGDKEKGYFLKDGKFHLRYGEDDNGILYTRLVYINPRQEYSVDCSFEFTEIGDSSHFGLLFGGTFLEKGYVFWLSPDGSWEIKLYVDGNMKPLISGQLGRSFNKGEAIRMQVVNRAGKVRFFIDESEVLTTYPRNSFGAEYGVIIYNIGAVEMDYFRVDHPRYDLNLVHDFDDYEVERLPPPLNTLHSDETAPVISPDGQTLYFAKDESFNSKVSVDQDIWISRANGELWSAPVRADKPLNNKGNNFVFSVREDQNQLLLGNSYTAEGAPNGDGISQTQREGDGWAIPRDVKLPDLINEDSQVSYCLSVDGKVMLMASESAAGFGESDLYYSLLQQDGTWSSPRNLGPDINTWGDEVDVFLAADMRTLYFAANGSYPGYGGHDIYVSRRIGEGWRQWSKPQNLGPKVNTRQDELHFSVTADGRYAYFNRYYFEKRVEEGSLDIFRMKLSQESRITEIRRMDFKAWPQEPPATDSWKKGQKASATLAKGSRPKAVAIVSGRVLDRETKKPLQADIVYRDLIAQKVEGKAISDPKTGAYSLVLPLEQLHGFMAEASGHVPLEDHLDLRNNRDTVLYIKRDLYLEKVRKGLTINLSNVFFVRAKADLIPASRPALERVYTLMQEYPRMKILLTGHTDNKGDPDNLQGLSEQRMEAVRTFLVGKGIAASRIEGAGKGGTQPAFPNSTERNRRKNRRVEFTILEL